MDKYPCVALPKNTHSTMLNVLRQQNILHDLNSFTRQICIIPVGIIPHFAQSWKFLILPLICTFRTYATRLKINL